MRKLFPAILLLLILYPASNAQDAKFSCRISLDVSAKEQLRVEATSYLSRELRSLGDVIVTDSDPTFIVQIVAIETHAGERANGYAFSVVVLEPISPGIARMMTANMNPKDKDLWSGYLSRRSDVADHFIQTGPELQELCKSIIASIDTDVIEKERKGWQSYQDYLKTTRNKTVNN